MDNSARVRDASLTCRSSPGYSRRCELGLQHVPSHLHTMALDLYNLDELLEDDEPIGGECTRPSLGYAGRPSVGRPGAGTAPVTPSHSGLNSHGSCHGQLARCHGGTVLQSGTLELQTPVRNRAPLAPIPAGTNCRPVPRIGTVDRRPTMSVNSGHHPTTPGAPLAGIIGSSGSALGPPTNQPFPTARRGQQFIRSPRSRKRIRSARPSASASENVDQGMRLSVWHNCRVPVMRTRCPPRPAEYPSDFVAGSEESEEFSKGRKVYVPRTETFAIRSFLDLEESDQASVRASSLDAFYLWLRDAANQQSCTTGKVKLSRNHFVVDIQKILGLGSGRGRKPGLACEQVSVSKVLYYTHIKWKFSIGEDGFFEIPYSSFDSPGCRAELTNLAVGLGLVTTNEDGSYSAGPSDLKIPAAPQAAGLNGTSAPTTESGSTAARPKPFSPVAVAARLPSQEGDALQLIVHPFPPTADCFASWAPGASEIHLEFSWSSLTSSAREFCSGLSLRRAVELGFADFTIPQNPESDVTSKAKILLATSTFDPEKEILVLAPPAATKLSDRGFHVFTLPIKPRASPCTFRL